MRPTILLTLLLSFECSCVVAQDSTKEWRFTKQIDVWAAWQRHPYFAEVGMPERIRQGRAVSTDLPTAFTSITDNPLEHGAVYVALKTTTSYRNKIFLFADLYGEHRGVSYGLFNRKNTVLYPVIQVEGRDTLTVGAKTLALKGRIGAFLDERVDEGLQVYNIDVQGMKFQADLGSFRFQYNLYGDLSNGIGLNIDDLQAISVSKKIPGGLIGLSWMIARPNYAPLRNNYSINFFAERALGNEDTKLYGQIGFRPLSMDPNFFRPKAYQQTALLAGIKTKKESGRLRYAIQGELRYYGFAWNFNYFDNARRYRDSAYDIYTMYANTVGPYLYPLRKYHTPFSQWALFTEYFDSEVVGANLMAKSAWRLSQKFDAFLDTDLMFLYAYLDPALVYAPEMTSAFFYPFFDGGIAYHPAPNTTARLSLTNKSMNLDVSYPTHYLFKKPIIQLTMFASFP